MPCASACSRVSTCRAEPSRFAPAAAPASPGARPDRGPSARARRHHARLRHARRARSRGGGRSCDRGFPGHAVAVERADRTGRPAPALDRGRQQGRRPAAKSVRAAAARDGARYGAPLFRRRPPNGRARRRSGSRRGGHLRGPAAPPRHLSLRRPPRTPAGPARPAAATGPGSGGRAGERVSGSAGDPPLRGEPPARARVRRGSAPRAHPRSGLPLRASSRVPAG